MPWFFQLNFCNPFWIAFSSWSARTLPHQWYSCWFILVFCCLPFVWVEVGSTPSSSFSSGLIRWVALFIISLILAILCCAGCCCLARGRMRICSPGRLGSCQRWRSYAKLLLFWDSVLVFSFITRIIILECSPSLKCFCSALNLLEPYLHQNRNWSPPSLPY